MRSRWRGIVTHQAKLHADATLRDSERMRIAEAERAAPVIGFADGKSGWTWRDADDRIHQHLLTLEQLRKLQRDTADAICHLESAELIESHLQGTK